MPKAILLPCVISIVLARALSPPVCAFDATDRYEPRAIEGWSIKVNKRLLEGQPELAERTLTHLRHHLQAIVHRLPAKAVEKLRDVPIWVEVEDKLHPCMCYHPDRQWLVEHDYNPEKAKCVELANAQNFLTWTIDQPWMVLHELAHAYHDRVLGFDHAEIQAAHQRAAAAKSYEQVLRISGKRERAYALTDAKEYFAECSEAFFGTNDFYPFVRSELAEHDPETFKLLGKLWQTDEAAAK